MKNYGTDFLILRGKKIQVQLSEVPQTNLKFYLENPRLYTIIRADAKEPTQDEIEETLARMDHVKQLVQSITENGGLIDAVIVQGGTNVVLEGNSRLAAYRQLAKTDPIKWGHLKAKILPSDISETDIFSILGEYHIIGKKDWSPFEQAGYLYRRHKMHSVSIDELAREINLSKRAIGHLVDVYQFMIDKNERDVTRWSYYDEYLRSNKFKRAREQDARLDDVVVAKIRSGEIARAVDVRDDLKKIVEAGGIVLEKFVNGKNSFVTATEAALNKGLGDPGVRTLKKFKVWIADSDNQKGLCGAEGETRKQCIFELKKVQGLSARLLKKMS